MLKDRKVLVEEELDRAKQAAAALYFKLAVHEGGLIATHLEASYATLKEKVANLQFDLNCINSLIEEGHQ